MIEYIAIFRFDVSEISSVAVEVRRQYMKIIKNSESIFFKRFFDHF